MRVNVKFLFGLLLWLLPGDLFSAVAVNGGEVTLPNSDVLTEYRLRVPDTSLMKSYREDASFDYVTENSEIPGWWKLLQLWFEKFFSGRTLFSGNGHILVAILKILAVLLGIFFIYKLIRARYSSPFGRKEKRFVEDFSDISECVDEISYPLLLENALSEKNYPQAVRIHYLYALYLLDAKGIICRSHGKTNVAYAYEIKDMGMRTVFSELSWIFDCVCYGEFEVDEPTFRRVDTQFKAFQKEIGG